MQVRGLTYINRGKKRGSDYSNKKVLPNLQGPGTGVIRPACGVWW